ncbi:hypothetical protein FPANT_2431 [Fusarium pseudoanthophilum]|uniref:Uncharacterized protein n=1 Tax=Fusarium pseudoanthophilum TaxID=48495 RepID=A0A8H5PNW2_9HYPO|nr:hypothetical protein FPANT_2431 [Fusarium pseudoanthophilum]
MTDNHLAGPSNPAPSKQPIEDGYWDLAKNRDHLQMRVEVDGRIPFQHVHLWSSGEEEKTGSGRMKTSTEQYKPLTHGPAVTPCPKTPTGAELVSDPKVTKEYVEVGLVPGDDPKKYSNVGTSTNSTSTKGKGKQTGSAILQRDENAMRVYIPVSEKLNPQAKFYEDVGGDRRNRVKALSENCRKAAALDKTSETRMAASLVPDLLEKISTAHPLVVTQPEHLASKLVLTWLTFIISGAKDNAFIKMMLATMEDCRGDLRYGPQTRTDAESAFFDFSCELSRAQSDELHEKVARLNPKLRCVDSELIMAVHKALRTNIDTELEGEHLGDILPGNALPFLLECCHNTIPMAHAHEDVVLREVKAILPFCQWHSNNCPRTSLQKAVDNGSTTSHPVTAQNFRAALLAVKSHIEDSAAHASRAVESVAGQHGALLKHLSMDVLMKKLGNATDVPCATSLFEQVAALHAVQYGITAHAAAQSNEGIIALIDQMLYSIDSGNL